MTGEQKGKLQAACYGVLFVGVAVKLIAHHWLGDVFLTTALIGFMLLILVRPSEALPNTHQAEFVDKTRSAWRVIAWVVIPLLAAKLIVTAFFAGSS